MNSNGGSEGSTHKGKQAKTSKLVMAQNVINKDNQTAHNDALPATTMSSGQSRKSR